MVSSLFPYVIGAFEASLSVLLTLTYGVIGAKFNMVNSTSAKDMSSLCVNMFLPALLITNIGKHLNYENLTNYIPIFVWAVVYAVISIILGQIATKFFNLPRWVIPACAFNNTTSLPLLLTKSLASTAVLSSIAGPDVADAVERAQSYFLLNSMVSNTATFAFGPKLLGCEANAEEDDEDGQDVDRLDENAAQQQEPDEETSLLPKPIVSAAAATEASASKHFHRLPHRLQNGLAFVWSMLNPTLWGSVIALAIGLTPPVKRIMFAKLEDGGWANAWLTSSLRSIGEIFTALQMFVVGSKLFDSMSQSKPHPDAIPKKGALLIIFLIRFVLWGVLSIAVIYFLAAKTSLLGDDPILWWAMMLMPIGPPAMILSSLAEVAGLREHGKMAIARLLTYAYAITPIMFLAVVASLKACERIVEEKSR